MHVQLKGVYNVYLFTNACNLFDLSWSYLAKKISECDLENLTT